MPSNHPQFCIKQREHNPMTYRYIFTNKHYEAVAKNLAALIIVTNNSKDAWKAVELISAMFEADNNRFKPKLFFQRVSDLASGS